jgi:hypothetical protein
MKPLASIEKAKWLKPNGVMNIEVPSKFLIRRFLMRLLYETHRLCTGI